VKWYDCAVIIEAMVEHKTLGYFNFWLSLSLG